MCNRSSTPSGASEVGSLRATFRVSWEGHDDVEVLTTARDVIDAVDVLIADEVDTKNELAAQTAIIWCALRRRGHPVGEYVAWLDELDSYAQVPGVTAAAGPTSPTRSATAPSPSPSTPAPTGGPGSTKTPAPSKPRKRS